MKDVILKGHPLTENESKKVKGGQLYDVDLESLATGFLKFCVACGNPFNGHYVFEDGLVVCQSCGCVNSIDELGQKE